MYKMNFKIKKKNLNGLSERESNPQIFESNPNQNLEILNGNEIFESESLKSE